LDRYRTGSLSQECQEMYVVGGKDGVGDASTHGRKTLSWTPGRKRVRNEEGQNGHVQSSCYAGSGMVKLCEGEAGIVIR
jgi:hypothetical protein